MMNETTQGTSSTLFRRVVEKAVCYSSLVKHYKTKSVLTMPVLYPSGALVTMTVEEIGNKFLVTDNASAFREAEQIGAERGFASHAKTISHAFDVEFDGRKFFSYASNEEQLSGTIMSVANCAARSIAETCASLTFTYYDDLKEHLGEELRKAFGNAVNENVSIKGASGDSYEMDYMVQAEGKLACFNAVTPHHSSLGATLISFQDLTLLEKPPIKVAAIRSAASFGPKISVLSSVANVIDSDTTEDQVRELILRHG